jgi:hypothetical protein
MNDFKKYIESSGLSPITITNYIRQLSRFNADLHADERSLIKHIKDNYKIGSQRQNMTVSVLKYRGYYNLPVDILRAYLQKAHQESLEIQSERTKNAVYPSMQEMKDKMKFYYTNENWREFCVMYLLLNFQTRNMDLVATIVSDKNDIETDKNYIYLRGSDSVFIRNSYKTHERYGQKKDTIKNKKFNTAIRNIEVGEVLLHGSNLTYEVRKITGGHTESTIMKMNVLSNNNLNSLMKISNNRGTNINTIHSNYNAT